MKLHVDCTERLTNALLTDSGKGANPVIHDALSTSQIDVGAAATCRNGSQAVKLPTVADDFVLQERIHQLPTTKEGSQTAQAGQTYLLQLSAKSCKTWRLAMQRPAASLEVGLCWDLAVQARVRLLPNWQTLTSYGCLVAAFTVEPPFAYLTSPGEC